jgi:hypothetical protein
MYMSILARGRIAWILGMVLGSILIVVGTVNITPPDTSLISAGAGFILFGLVLLVLSFVTHGQPD